MSLSASVTVTVSAPSGGPTPWRKNDFSQYANIAALLADRYNAASKPGGWWSPATEDSASNRMTLETSGGPPGGSTQFVRYNWPDRTTALCTDSTIRINVQLPQSKADIWLSAWCRFSSNFTTVAPGCTSNPSYKFIFGRVTYAGPGNHRYGLLVGTSANRLISLEYPSLLSAVNATAVPATSYFDGNWHRWRMHCKASTTVGRFAVYFDDTRVKDLNNVNSTTFPVYGFSLGNNTNQRPIITGQYNDWGLLEIYDTDPGWGF